MYQVYKMLDYKKIYMLKCIRLDKKAQGKVSPNPLVGALVLDKKGNIVGQGYHKQYGAPHAEVMALNMAGEKAFEGTLFVNLEPCSHYGKTPPCTDLIIKYKIKKVIIGMIDPNPLVSGKGVRILQDSGIDVEVGILEERCKLLNEIFIKNMEKNKLFVSIKTATTLDGKIATSNNKSKWITSIKSRRYVQLLRNKYDALVTSSNTVINDNPKMNCRLKNSKNPIRVILDSHLNTDPKSYIYNNDGTKIYIFTLLDHNSDKFSIYPEYVNIITSDSKDNKISLNFVCDYLYKEGIRSILIEAGGILNGAFIKENLCDKLYHFIGPKIMNDQNAKSWAVGCNIFDMHSVKTLVIKNTKFLKPDLFVEAYFV